MAFAPRELIECQRLKPLGRSGGMPPENSILGARKMMFATFSKQQFRKSKHENWHWVFSKTFNICMSTVGIIDNSFSVCLQPENCEISCTLRLHIVCPSRFFQGFWALFSSTSAMSTFLLRSLYMTFWDIVWTGVHWNLFALIAFDKKGNTVLMLTGVKFYEITPGSCKGQFPILSVSIRKIHSSSLT